MQSFARRNHKTEKSILLIVVGVCIVMIGLLGYLYHLDMKSRPLVEFPKYNLSTTDWTSGNVVITVEEEEKISEYSFDGGENYQEGNTYEVFTNGNFSIMVRDINGRLSKAMPISIRNIDKEAPIITFEENTTIYLGSNFSLRNGVNAYDEGSGLDSNYVTVPEKLDTSVAGTYKIQYTAFDKVGNYTEKTRTVTVSTIKGDVFYRSRSISYENYDCEPYLCNCVVAESATLNSSCPTGYTFNEPNKCCQTCHKTCKKIIYGKWSEWIRERITPTPVLEVETRIE